MPTVTRRGYLATLGAGTTGALAGCSGGGGHTYRFSTTPLGADLSAVARRFVHEDLAALSAQYSIDYPREHRASVVETLFETGSVAVDQYQLTWDYDYGTTTRPFPRFAADDAGQIHFVRLDEATDVTERQWAFYLDLVDEAPPSSASVVRSPPSSLSALDRRVVRAAADAVSAGRSRPLNASDYEFPHQGVRFHEHMEPADSELLPSPPFDYFRAGENHFAAAAERGETTVTRRQFRARTVGNVAADVAAVLDESFVDARIARSGLGDAATAVLDTATAMSDGRLHVERGQMSDGLTAVADRLGMTDHLPEEFSSVTFHGALFRYDGKWFEGGITAR